MSAPPDFIGIGTHLAGGLWWADLLGDHPLVHGPADGDWSQEFFSPFCARPMQDADVAAYKPKYVTIPLGMNDGSYTPFTQEIFDTYQHDMSELLERINFAWVDDVVHHAGDHTCPPSSQFSLMEDRTQRQSDNEPSAPAEEFFQLRWQGVEWKVSGVAALRHDGGVAA